MSTPSRELDVLDLLLDEVEAWQRQLRQTESTDYVEGQLAYMDALVPAIRRASQTTPPNQILEDVAGELGLASDGQELHPCPTTQREAGILAMWSICLGLTQGLAGGAQAAMQAVKEMSGKGSFGAR